MYVNLKDGDKGEGDVQVNLIGWLLLRHSRKIRRESWLWVHNMKIPTLNLNQRSSL